MTELPIALLLYVALGGAYLIVFPALILAYLRGRWYKTSSIERVLMFFLVFLFFPGFLLLGPFVNWRPQPRKIPA